MQVVFSIQTMRLLVGKPRFAALTPLSGASSSSSVKGRNGSSLAWGAPSRFCLNKHLALRSPAFRAYPVGHERASWHRRSTRRNIFLALIAAMLVAEAIVLPRYFLPAELVESWVLDIRVASLTPPETKHDDIIILGINESTMAQEVMHYRSPKDREQLALWGSRIRERSRSRVAPPGTGMSVNWVRLTAALSEKSPSLPLGRTPVPLPSRSC